MRVVLAEDVADNRRALSVARRREQALLVGAIEDATVHGLEPVAHIGDGAADDDAHRVVQVGRTHLVLNRDGHPLLRRGRRCRRCLGHSSDRCSRSPPLGREGSSQKKLPMVNSKTLRFFVGQGSEREAPLEAQRTERREPADAEAVRRAEVAEAAAQLKHGCMTCRTATPAASCRSGFGVPRVARVGEDDAADPTVSMIGNSSSRFW